MLSLEAVKRRVGKVIRLDVQPKSEAQDRDLDERQKKSQEWRQVMDQLRHNVSEDLLKRRNRLWDDMFWLRAETRRDRALVLLDRFRVVLPPLIT